LQLSYCTAPQLQSIPWWSKNILRRGANARLGGGQKYTKYDKINNNSENFRRAKLLLGGLCPSCPLSYSYGPAAA